MAFYRREAVNCVDALRSLARTTAIVVPLGLLLYLGLAVLAQRAGAQYWLALLLAGPLAAFLACHLAHALRSGWIAVGRRALARADHPVGYWLWVIWDGVMAVLLLVLCLYAAGRLAAA